MLYFTLFLGSALYVDTYGGDQSAFGQFSESTQFQIGQMRDAILRGQLPTHFMQKLDEICDPCRRQVSLDEIMLLFPLPDLTSGGTYLIINILKDIMIKNLILCINFEKMAINGLEKNLPRVRYILFDKITYY